MISAQTANPKSFDAEKAVFINNLRADITATNEITRSRTMTKCMGIPNAQE